MSFNIENWIESVRQKPEHIRERYVILCVAVAMVFVVGVWLLSVTESFKTVSTETSEEAATINTLIPKPADFSLDTLLKNKQSLGSEATPVSGQEYFQDEYQKKAPPQFGDEGVAPVPEQETP